MKQDEPVFSRLTPERNADMHKTIFRVNLVYGNLLKELTGMFDGLPAEAVRNYMYNPNTISDFNSNLRTWILFFDHSILEIRTNNSEAKVLVESHLDKNPVQTITKEVYCGEVLDDATFQRAVALMRNHLDYTKDMYE